MEGLCRLYKAQILGDGDKVAKMTKLHLLRVHSRKGGHKGLGHAPGQWGGKKVHKPRRQGGQKLLGKREGKVA